MIKMILTDLDHTLLRQDGSISSDTLKVIEKCRDNGILFSIATARYWIGAERYIEMLRPDYEITTDGTLIHSKGKCIFSSQFTKSETNEIISSIKEAVPLAEITVAVEKCVYWNSKHISESEKLYKAKYNNYSSYFDEKGNKIVAELPNAIIVRKIADKTGCKPQSYRGEKWYTFLPKDSGKISAIRSLIKSSSISSDSIVAFGDDDNDIDMLKLCGKGIAVANAVPDVIKIADAVTLTNDEDGVAKWLSENCL